MSKRNIEIRDVMETISNITNDNLDVSKMKAIAQLALFNLQVNEKLDAIIKKQKDMIRDYDTK